MKKDIGIWVCPRCNVLQGIEVWLEGEEMKARCVSCGVSITPDDVLFLDQDMARRVISEVEGLIPSDLHSFERYSWVSNKTIVLF